jgi:(1->4)-alpha-D-glucan 1-alpha-D-glucosylmutase
VVELDQFPLGESVWGDTAVEVPKGSEYTWHEMVTDHDVTSGNFINIGQALSHFPAALIVNQVSNN